MNYLRGVKRDAWEGGHRVPFLARWPDHIPAGAVSQEIICQVDLMATAAALVGATMPTNAAEDSYNILPALLGEPLATPIREATVLHSGDGKFALRQGDWVLIAAHSGDDNVGSGAEPAWLKQARGYTNNPFAGQLYNLRDDLIQRHNHYGDNPAMVAQLKSLLTKYKVNGRSTPGPRLKSTPSTVAEPALRAVPDESAPIP